MNSILREAASPAPNKSTDIGPKHHSHGAPRKTQPEKARGKAMRRHWPNSSRYLMRLNVGKSLELIVASTPARSGPQSVPAPTRVTALKQGRCLGELRPPGPQSSVCCQHKCPWLPDRAAQQTLGCGLPRSSRWQFC